MRWLMLLAFACGGRGDCPPGTIKGYSDCHIEETLEPPEVGDAPPPPPPPSATAQALDALRPCTPRDPAGDYDLYEGCTEGLCIGDRYDEWVEAFGEPSSCTTQNDYNRCWFDDGLAARFRDLDGDGVIGDQIPADQVHVQRPYVVRSETGLGIGALLSCFLDELGPPDRVYLHELDDGTEAVMTIHWFEHRVLVSDWKALTGENEPDGRADSVYSGF